MGDKDIFLTFVPQITNSVNDMKKIILLAIGILTFVTMMADTIKKNYQYQSLTYEYNKDTKEATLTFGGIINGEDYSKIPWCQTFMTIPNAPAAWLFWAHSTA